MLLIVLLLVLPAAAEEESLEEQLALQQLSREARVAVVRVTEDPTVTCRLPAREVRSRSLVMRRLLLDLPLAAKVVRALELGDYDITSSEEADFHIDDGSGANAACEIVHEEDGRLVVVAKGYLDVRLLPRVEGVGVILVRYQPGKETGRLRCQGTVFFRLNHGVLHMATAPFRGALGRVLSSKLEKLIRCATDLAVAITTRPGEVFRQLQGSGELSAGELAQFRERYLVH